MNNAFLVSFGEFVYVIKALNCVWMGNEQGWEIQSVLHDNQEVNNLVHPIESSQQI